MHLIHLRWLGAACLIALSACAAVEEGATQAARNSAKTAVNGVVEQRFPGLNAAPITDCIIDNATLSEILTLARAAGTGVDPETVNTVVGIAQRPETVQCISQAGLSLLS